MTNDEIAGPLITLAISIGAGILAALFTFAWIWRTRDRQIARVGSLAQLEASAALDEEAKAEIALRIRREVDDILRGDASRRAFAVQRFFYLFLSALFLGLGVWGSLMWTQGNRTGGALLFGGGFMTFLFALGITAVPSYRWRMPKFLRSYAQPDDSSPRSSPTADAAVDASSVKAGDRVAVFTASRDNPGAAPGLMQGLRRAVGDAGVVIVVTAGARAAEWMQDGVVRMRYTNVTVLTGGPSDSAFQRVGGSEKLEDLALVIVDAPIAAKVADLPVGITHLRQMLASDGAALVVVKNRRAKSSAPSADDVERELQAHFGPRVLRARTSRILGETRFMVYKSDSGFAAAPHRVLHR